MNQLMSLLRQLRFLHIMPLNLHQLPDLKDLNSYMLQLAQVHLTEDEDNMSIYDYSVKNAKNEDVKLADYNGKVILIVNTATGCGFTPHYEQLESMYKKFHDKGLEIIYIPCNQFGGQAPGTDDEIHQFCTLHYNTTFPQMKKSEVNGENELPLYTYLKQQKGFEGLPEGKYSELLIKMFK